MPKNSITAHLASRSQPELHVADRQGVLRSRPPPISGTPTKATTERAIGLLNQPPTLPAMETTEDRDVRVADYLDDKLQILGDLDALDSLLSNIRNQHGLLKKQVRRAQRVSSAYADTWIARRCRKRPRGS